jgi:hypothetical protein
VIKRGFYSEIGRRRRRRRRIRRWNRKVSGWCVFKKGVKETEKFSHMRKRFKSRRTEHVNSTQRTYNEKTKERRNSCLCHPGVL